MPVTKSKKKKSSMSTKIVCQCDGKGMWSDCTRTTTISNVRIVVQPISQLEDGSITQVFEFEVYFSKKDWNVDKHGLIYTDDGWLNDFCKGFGEMTGYNFKELDYTEQGMQGDNYVSLDIVCFGERAIKKFFAAVQDKDGIEFGGYPDEFC